MKWLVITAALAFFGCLLALFRQRLMIAKMDPLVDTGASFGLVAINWACVFSGMLLGLLLVVMIAMYIRRG